MQAEVKATLTAIFTTTPQWKQKSPGAPAEGWTGVCVAGEDAELQR